jgi:hypothetical protein
MAVKEWKKVSMLRWLGVPTTLHFVFVICIAQVQQIAKRETRISTPGSSPHSAPKERHPVCLLRGLSGWTLGWDVCS